MSERALQLQLALLAVVAGLLTVASLVYVLAVDLESLHTTRNGVPFFTPAVEHPDSGESITVDELVRHYVSG